MRSRQLNDRRHGRSKAIVAIASIAAFGLLGSGCSLERFDPDPEPIEIERPPDLESPDAQAGSLNGVWEGTYTCNQGLTRLHLTLAQTSSGRVSGILRFSPDPSNPEVPSGSFRVEGTLAGSSLSLRGDSWISRPGDYQMVSLRARLSPSTPDRIQGTVVGGGCTTFTVRRN